MSPFVRTVLVSIGLTIVCGAFVVLMLSMHYGSDREFSWTIFGVAVAGSIAVWLFDRAGVR